MPRVILVAPLIRPADVALPLILSLVTLHAPGVDVDFRGGAGCDAAMFHAGLARHIAPTSATRPVRVSVETRARDDGQIVARLTLTSSDRETTRELHGATCDAVTEAAAFVTAVIVDPGLVPPPESSIPSIPTPPPAAPDPLQQLEPRFDPPLPPTAPPANPASPPRFGGHLRLGGGLETLGLPHTGPLAQLVAGMSAPRWRLELAGLYRGPTVQESPESPVAALIRLWAVGLRGCGVLRPGPLEVPLCLGVEVGQTRARGIRFEGARSGTQLWTAAVLAPALAWAPRRLGGFVAFSAGLELAVPLRPGVFAVNGFGELYSLGPVSLRAVLGLELRFAARRRP